MNAKHKGSTYERSVRQSMPAVRCMGSALPSLSLLQSRPKGLMMDDEMFTPQWIFDALDLHFDLDVASSHNPLITVPSKKRFTIEENGLDQEWHGLVWMNPPFSKVTPWIEKWLHHNNGLCLVPLSSNGRWVNRLWESDASITYLPPNMAFIGGKDGKEVKHRWRTALWAIGSDNVKALQKSKIGKVR